MEQEFGADRFTGNCSAQGQCGSILFPFITNQKLGEEEFVHCSLAFCSAHLLLFPVDDHAEPLWAIK